MADFMVLSSNFGQEVPGYHAGDADCDGTVTFTDFLALSANYGRSSNTQTTPVPEPSATLLFALGLIGVARIRSVY